MALQVVQDKEGDVWLFDPVTETLYMDTGDATVGMLAVTREGQMYNFFVDPDTGKVRPLVLICFPSILPITTSHHYVPSIFP